MTESAFMSKEESALTSQRLCPELKVEQRSNTAYTRPSTPPPPCECSWKGKREMKTWNVCSPLCAHMALGILHSVNQTTERKRETESEEFDRMRVRKDTVMAGKREADRGREKKRETEGKCDVFPRRRGSSARQTLSGTGATHLMYVRALPSGKS